jgi:hypothetical protein
MQFKSKLISLGTGFLTPLIINSSSVDANKQQPLQIKDPVKATVSKKVDRKNQDQTLNMPL